MKNQNLETNSQIRGNSTPGQHLSYSIPRRNRFIDESFLGKSEDTPSYNNSSYNRPSKLNRTTIQDSRVQNSIKPGSSLLDQLNLSSLDVSRHQQAQPMTIIYTPNVNNINNYNNYNIKSMTFNQEFESAGGLLRHQVNSHGIIGAGGSILTPVQPLRMVHLNAPA